MNNTAQQIIKPIMKQNPINKESIFALAEFRISEEVTYTPYERSHKMKVSGYRHGANGTGHHDDGTKDNRLYYCLGTSAITTGKCIVESALFEENGGLRL